MALLYDDKINRVLTQQALNKGFNISIFLQDNLLVGKVENFIFRQLYITFCMIVALSQADI